MGEAEIGAGYRNQSLLTHLIPFFPSFAQIMAGYRDYLSSADLSGITNSVSSTGKLISTASTVYTR